MGATKLTADEQRLERFIDRYSPEVAAVARGALERMRELLPGAIEMVYDNYLALVIGFGASDRASAAILSIGLYPRWVNVYFLNGVGLPDPQRLLKGSGKQVRNIRLEDAADLDRPEVRTLIAAAVERSAEPFEAGAPRRLIIKAVAENRRPRRPK